MLDSHAEASYLISAVSLLRQKNLKSGKIWTGDATTIKNRNLPVLKN